MAKAAEVSVVPLGIREEGEMVAWGKWGKTKITVHVGQPVDFKGDMPDFIEQARKQVGTLANKATSTVA